MTELFLETIQPSLCSSCGACCAFRPGRTIPADWGATDAEIATNIQTALASGLYTSDPWMNDPRYEGLAWEERPADALDYVPMIRPNGREYVGRLTHEPWFEKVPCVFLGETGCQKAFSERPYECRALMPSFDAEGKRACDTIGMSRKNAAILWVPYAPMVNELIRALGQGDTEGDV
jgi:Fe-S-cluster containining protein